MEIPQRSDGSEYKIRDLAMDQKESLAYVLHTVRQYCEGHEINKEQVLRLTVSGVAGSGKSTWINTLVTALRKLFPESDTVSVYAPTGSAAFNAGGQTVHRGFKVPIPVRDLGISAAKNQYLLGRFGKTLVIIIDERSMLEATMLGIIKYYMQKCAHSGSNPNHPWGGIPIIILVGDDYQLPPIMPGAFYALHPDQLERTRITPDAQVTMRAAGFAEFIELGKTVIYLEGEKRVNDGQDMFKRLLRAVRCEDETKQMTEDEAQTLLELDLSHPSFSDQNRRLIGEEATYVFANREPRDRLNSMKLKMANLKENPVARIKSVTMRKAGRRVSGKSCFDEDRQPNKVLLCKDARVTMNGYNPDPKNGLFHGSLGVVRDIVYDEGKKPNFDDFPAYVLVEFYQYCGQDMIPNKPRLIPVVAHTVRCNEPCNCTRTYMPLALAYGKTAHTFQGMNVGPVPPGRPENPIKKIIVDPGKRAFEGQNVGLFYQLLSRATTIGVRGDKLSSAIYFDGQNFSRKRFENLAMKNGKELYKKAALRRDWVSYLRENEVKKGQWTAEQMEDLFTWAETTRIEASQLDLIIANRPKT
jgi:hypothetical protein